MPALIIYLLKVNIALILFYLAYRFVLRWLTFYTLNRFFLVSGIIFASAYPFIDLSDIFIKHTEINDKLIVIVPDWSSVEKAVLPYASFNYWQLIIAIFWLGVVTMAVRLTIQLISLYRIHRSSKPEVLNNYAFRRIKEKVNPFSFWQSIYLNPAQHPQKELEAILQHEKVHVEEWHTLDILLAELSVVFYWFNPGVWLMKQAVKENLEFITDLKVLNSGLDSKIYQYSLVQISTLPQSYSLANNFNFMSIKKRIMMMNKKQSSKIQVSRYLLMLPVVIVLTFVFTISKAQLEKRNFKTFTKNSFSAIKKVLSSVNSVPSVITEAAESFRQEAQPIINEIFITSEDFTTYPYAIAKPAIDTSNKKLPNVQQKSVRAPATIKIDGKRPEWDNQIQAINKAAGILYTISNDDDKLYLAVLAPDQDIANKIINAGITFTINGSGKAHDESGMAITFPFLYYEDHRPAYPLLDYNKEAIVMNKQLTDKTKDIRVAGIKGIKDTISIYNPEEIKAAALFGEDRVFTYELAIPLKYLGLSVKEPQPFVYTIKLNGTPTYQITLNPYATRNGIPQPSEPKEIRLARVYQTEAIAHVRPKLRYGITMRLEGNTFVLGGATGAIVTSLISPTWFSGEYTLAK